MRTLIKSFLVLVAIFFLMQDPVYAQYRRFNGRYQRGYYPRLGERVYLNRPAYIIPYGGYHYHYLNGIFYRPYGSYYRVIAPPIGIRIGVLPYGYNSLYMGGYPYYYFNGTFYRPWEDGSYEVIAPPVGAQVAELPEGARAVVIDNRKYYEFNGTYYKETIRENGEIWYTVTGKNGNVEEQQEPDQQGQPDNYNQQQPSSQRPPNTVPQPQQEPPITRSRVKIGMEVSILPEGSKTVITNNQKYFVSPDDTYYQEQIENNEIYYRVVPKPAQ